MASVAPVTTRALPPRDLLQEANQLVERWLADVAGELDEADPVSDVSPQHSDLFADLSSAAI